MARTIAEIQALIIQDKETRTELAGLSSSSKVSLWRLWTFIVATAIWTLEVLFDKHKEDTLEQLTQMKPHSLIWYRNKALLFQYGQELVDDTDYYDNTGLTTEQIDEKRIVRFAAVTEVEDTAYGVRLRIKAAKTVNNELAPLNALELAAFKGYCERIKDAGNKLQVDSLSPDRLRLTYDIYYDPLVLNTSGERLDGSNNTPVKEAIEAYLKALPFNGEFRLAALTDKLQNVEGVVIPELKAATTKWGSFSWRTVDAKYIPDAGYLRIYNDSDLSLNFRAYTT